MVETCLWMHLLLVSLFSFSHSTYCLIHALRDDLLSKLMTTTSWLQHPLFGEPNKGKDHHPNVSCPCRELALRLQCTSMRAEMGWWPNSSVRRNKPWFSHWPLVLNCTSSPLLPEASESLSPLYINFWEPIGVAVPIMPITGHFYLLSDSSMAHTASPTTHVSVTSPSEVKMVDSHRTCSLKEFSGGGSD